MTRRQLTVLAVLAAGIAAGSLVFAQQAGASDGEPSALSVGLLFVFLAAALTLLAVTIISWDRWVESVRPARKQPIRRLLHAIGRKVVPPLRRVVAAVDVRVRRVLAAVFAALRTAVLAVAAALRTVALAVAAASRWVFQVIVRSTRAAAAEAREELTRDSLRAKRRTLVDLGQSAFVAVMGIPPDDVADDEPIWASPAHRRVPRSRTQIPRHERPMTNVTGRSSAGGGAWYTATRLNAERARANRALAHLVEMSRERAHTLPGPD